jgi:type IV pilus assembly protein PilY1
MKRVVVITLYVVSYMIILAHFCPDAMASMADYVSYPPFLSQSVQPNVMVVLDTSTSMLEFAYQQTGTQWSTDTSDPFPAYDGYFDPSKNYSYSTTYNYFYEDASGTWSGSLLNFICMRRMDIAKKVLTGGRTAIAGNGSTVLVSQPFPNGCGNPDLYDQWKEFNQGGTIRYARHYRVADPIGGYFYLCDSAGSPYGTRFYTRVKITSTPSGIIQESAPSVRFGLTIYSPAGSADHGGKVLEPCAAGTATHIQNIVSDINSQDMLSDPVGQDTWTPMAETLYTVAGYFGQDPTTGAYGPMYHPGDYQVNDTWDPYYFDTSRGDATTGKLDCVKSFVIMISDGDANHDSDLPAFLKDTIPSSPPGGVTGTDNYLDDVAYWAHTTDLRTDLTGEQTLTLYTISTFGGGADLLQSAARYGGFTDSNGNNLPDLQAEWDADGDGVPDNYFPAGTAEELTEALGAAIQNIVLRNTLSHTGAGSAASVVSSTRAGEGAVYQAVFYPTYRNEVSWAGEVHALLIDAYGNMREDSNDNKILDLDNDLVVQFDTSNPGQVFLYKDLNADGQLTAEEKTSADQATYGLPKHEKMEDLHYLWSTTTWLNGISDAAIVTQRTYATIDQKRYIFTLIDGNGNMVADSAEQIDFDASHYATISPYLHLFNPFTTPPSGFNETTAAQAQINFIRGLDQTKMRSRRYVADPTTGATMTYRLGDVIDSTPTAVGPPAEGYDLIYRDVTYQSFYAKYRNRRTVVYAGANDGMFHAFNGGFFTYDSANQRYKISLQSQGGTETPFALGAELWAYVPFNLLPHLYWLTRFDYQHVYYCDLKPRVFDAKIFTADTYHPNGWGTILVGGMRFGGGRIRTDKNHNGTFEADDVTMKSAYFILDITNPEAPPKVLAEVSFDDLGYTTSYPGVVLMRDDASTPPVNNWYLVLGSGPNGVRLKYTGSGTFTVGSTGRGQRSGASGVVVRQDSTNGLTLRNVVGGFQHGETAFQDNDGDNVLDVGEPAVTVDLTNSVLALRDGASSQEARIYMIDLVQLAQGHVWAPGGTTASTPLVQLDDNSFVSDIVSADLNLNYKTDVAYFGTVSGQPGSWGGKLRRIVFNDSTAPAGWTVDSTLIDVMQPVTAAPALALDPLGQTWVFFGTGRYMTVADASDTSQQTYYGVKEPTTTPWSGVLTSALLDVSGIVVFEGGTIQCENATPPPDMIECADVTDLNGNGTKDLNDLEIMIDGDPNHIPPITGKAGWFLNFPDAGERNLGQAALLGDVLSFTTYIPRTQLCGDDEGTSSLWAVYFKTGTAFSTSVIGLDKSQSISETGTTRYKVLRRTDLGKGLAASPSIHTGREQGSKAFIQTSTGTVVVVPETNPGVTKSGKAYWKEESGSK